MDYFIWKDSFCIGIKELDAQHEAFLACVNDCQAQVSSGIRGAIDPALLTRLATYAAEHFRYEEDMMRHTGYPDLGAQVRQHKFFVSQVEALEAAHTTGRDADVRSVLVFLRDWFLEHILSLDLKFAAYLQDQRRGRRI